MGPKYTFRKVPRFRKPHTHFYRFFLRLISSGELMLENQSFKKMDLEQKINQRKKKNSENNEPAKAKLSLMITKTDNSTGVQYCIIILMHQSV